MIRNKIFFITGNSSGLGLALYNLLVNNNTVYSISKSKLKNKNSNHLICNFKSKNLIKKMIFFKNIKKIDYLILNAGILGDINKSSLISSKSFSETININLYANKIILDYFLNKKILIKNVIGISSGAALGAKEGWLSYCTSKAAFKMLIDVYRLDYKKINFINVSPGLIRTNMQKEIFKNKNNIKSLIPFKKLYKEKKIHNPEYIANKIINFLCNNKNFKHSYIDLRNI